MVVVVEGPLLVTSGLFDLEDNGILFLLLMCMIMTQIMSIRITIIAESSAAKNNICGGVEDGKSDLSTDLDCSLPAIVMMQVHSFEIS